MIFAWLRYRRRRKLLAAPFPAAWNDILRANAPHDRFLDDRERAKLRDDLRVTVRRS